MTRAARCRPSSLAHEGDHEKGGERHEGDQEWPRPAQSESGPVRIGDGRHLDGHGTAARR